MLEAYLFIDPLCTNCIRSENNVLKIAKNLDNQILYQFIPVLSINMRHHQNRYYDRHQLSDAEKCRINYEAVLDYYAALFQGRKFGRRFLLLLQNALLTQNQEYNDKLVLNIARQAKLDLKMFKEDRRSKIAKDSFKRDQKLAIEMHIKKTASAVIFDCDSDRDGVRFDSFNYQELYDACRNFSKDELFKCGFNGYRIPNLANLKL